VKHFNLFDTISALEYHPPPLQVGLPFLDAVAADGNGARSLTGCQSPRSPAGPARLARHLRRRRPRRLPISELYQVAQLAQLAHSTAELLVPVQARVGDALFPQRDLVIDEGVQEFVGKLRVAIHSGSHLAKANRPPPHDLPPSGICLIVDEANSGVKSQVGGGTRVKAA
jgi:hypothetical protein